MNWLSWLLLTYPTKHTRPTSAASARWAHRDSRPTERRVSSFAEPDCAPVAPQPTPNSGGLERSWAENKDLPQRERNPRKSEGFGLS